MGGSKIDIVRDSALHFRHFSFSTIHNLKNFSCLNVCNKKFLVKRKLFVWNSKNFLENNFSPQKDFSFIKMLNISLRLASKLICKKVVSILHIITLIFNYFLSVRGKFHF
jgi:hypothetical protein